jgi:hypothetical protein
MCINLATAVSSFSGSKNECYHTKTPTPKSPDAKADFSRSTTNLDKGFFIDHRVAVQATSKRKQMLIGVANVSRTVFSSTEACSRDDDLSRVSGQGLVDSITKYLIGMLDALFRLHRVAMRVNHFV